MSEKLVVEMCPRPESRDEDVAFVMGIHVALEKRPGRTSVHDFEAGEFVECDGCAAKPGMPSLCSGCLANRHVIGLLRAHVARMGIRCP